MAVAVICEFNPFHFGHKYLLDKVKATKDEPVIAIMSGSFTQRGEVAITDKYSRAKTALENGADLVVELPTAYAVSNAQSFAQGGVRIAACFEDVTTLAFGCEAENAENLIKAAQALDNTEVCALISKKMNEGEYYPKAVESAVREVMGDDVAEVFASPNNVLAIEYIRAMNGIKLKPMAITRKGIAHDSKVTAGEFASASYIRELLRNGKSADSFLPAQVQSITRAENLERAILYKLRTMSIEELASLADVKEGLENRLYNAIKSKNSVDDIISEVKTKRYTHARIRRIVTSALLGITKELQSTPIEYVRVLGFTDNGAALLKNCSLEVITSVSKGLKLGGNIEKLLTLDIRATDIQAVACDIPLNMGRDFTEQIIKVKAK